MMKTAPTDASRSRNGSLSSQPQLKQLLIALAQQQLKPLRLHGTLLGSQTSPLPRLYRPAWRLLPRLRASLHSRALLLPKRGLRRQTHGQR